MARGFDGEFKELVRTSTNLVDVVSETVSLKPLRGGSDFVGLCPFHDDRNPSLHVYPDRQSYRCWVCDAGGDCFRWVMELEKVSFPEAIESLARRAGLELPQRRQTAAEAGSELQKGDAYAILDWAANLMHQALRTGAAGGNARTYLQKRSLQDDTVRGFRLGYHPEDWSWFQDQSRGRFSAEQLILAGLICRKESGYGHYDNLVGRLVFPISDERGRVVAFGGRVLPGGSIESDAKYWNSQQSGIFHKSRTLYAFDRSREAIRKSRTAIVVEGYMDCIACQQAGVKNVVATLGTALTEDHVRFLRRFADQVVLTFDGDLAGQKAAERSISRFLAQDLDLRILTLPGGLDPADFLEQHSAEEFQERIAAAAEAWEYKLQSVLQVCGTQTVNGRQQVLTQMMEFIAASSLMPGSLREDLILRNVCQKIQLSESVARRILRELREKSNRAVPPAVRLDRGTAPAAAAPDDAVPRNGGAFELAERELLEIILTCPETIDLIRHRIGPDDFENTRHRRLLELCLDLRIEEGELPEIHRLIIAAESDADLLSLINAAADAAAQKGIRNLLLEQPQPHEADRGVSVPVHLLRVLKPLLERRARQQYLKPAQPAGQAEESAGELSVGQRDALNRLYSFRLNQMGRQHKLK